MPHATPPSTLPPQVRPPAFSLTEEPLTASGGSLVASGESPVASGESLVVAVPVLPADGEASSLSVGPGAEQVADALGLDLLALLEAHGAKGRAGEVVTHPVLEHDTVTAVLLVGTGDGGPDALRAAGAALGRAVKDRDLLATSVPSVAGDDGLHAFVVGLTLGSFEFHWRSEGAKAHPVRRVLVAGDADRQSVVEAATTVAAAGWRARELATVPSNLKNPGWLADRAAEVAAETGLGVTVWDEKRLAKEGFGGILAVGGASATPPRMIRLDHRPRKATGHVVLVGKGITFDTGGLSIKPGEAMVNMKRDMTGGAVVIATMGALAALGCPVRVTGLVAAAENAIDGSAYRPGDVVRHYGGRTTEVTNTDAEGRVVLADAMAYAVKELKPDVLVDVATLTGAMKVALGLRTGGYFANHDGLAEVLAEAGRGAGERLWRMPLFPDYEEKLSSKVADADNAPGGPGAITAALFLQHFAGDVPWAHLDIASVGDAPEDRDEWTAGPTGFGVRTLLAWLSGDDPLAAVR